MPKEKWKCLSFHPKPTFLKFSVTWILKRSKPKCLLKRQELKDQEMAVIEAGDLDSAERLHNEINELREKEILLKNFIIIEQNQRAVN